MVPRLWVPDCHRLEARNWNLAASGAAFTASRVANSMEVSTPLRTGLSVMVMSLVLSGDGSVTVLRWNSDGEGLARRGCERRQVGEDCRLLVEQPAQLLLQ